MQSRLSFFSIAALNNMRALMLIFLTCCVYFELVNGIKAGTKVAGNSFSKFAEADVLGKVMDRNTQAMLDLKGGKELVTT